MKHEMPRYYTGVTWKTLRRSSIPVRCIERPCSICGWAQHMAIHEVPECTETPIGPIGLHSYKQKDRP